MTRPHRTFLRHLRVLAWGLLAVAPALAQLDPKLQASKTDFLDLYQQSTSLKVKPEILSVFDCSATMSQLMFHPLYRNNDVEGKDDWNRTASVTLSGTGNFSTDYTFTTLANNKCADYQYGWITIAATTGLVTYASCWSADSTLNCNPSVTPPSSWFLEATWGPSSICGAYVNFAIDPAWTGPTAAQPYPKWKVSSYSNNNISWSCANAQFTNVVLSPPAAGGVYYTPGETVTATSTMWSHAGEGITSYSTVGWWLYAPTSAGFDDQSKTTTRTTAELPNETHQSTLTFKIPSWTAPALIDPIKWTGMKVVKINSTTVNITNWYELITRGVKSGDVLTFSQSLNPAGATTKITWSVSGGSGCSAAGPITPVATPTNLTQPWTATWTVPGPCPPTGSLSTDVSIQAPAGTYSVPGVTYNGNYTVHGPLVKPNGSLVTEADAEAAKALPDAISQKGKWHIVNWLRAASHARLYNGAIRAIDVPLPWRIFDRNSTGNPLSDQTVTDTKTATGGSGLPITMDTLNGTTADFGSSGVVNPTTVTIPTVTFPPAYLGWMFNAKYQNTNSSAMNYTPDSTLVGKYVVFDAQYPNIAGRQGTNLSWGQGFGPSTSGWGPTSWPSYKMDGSYAGQVYADASSYRLPALTRLQALKKAAIQAWIEHQADAYWAFRTLSTIESGATGTNSTYDNYTDGTATWRVLNNTAAQGINSTTGNSVTGMAAISRLTAASETPLTYGLARSLAQYADPSSVFNAVVGTDVSQCGNSYLLLISDGMDNNGYAGSVVPSASPYFTGSGATMALNASNGNFTIIHDKASINRTGAYWNAFTMAGIGAHMADGSLGTVNEDYLAQGTPARVTGKTPDFYLPLAIKQRSGITLNRDRRVLTMTMGVGMGGYYTDTTSPKRTLYLAAVAGDPGIISGPLSGFHPFDPTTDWEPDPRDPGNFPTVGKRKDGAVYFFDATDVDRMISSMNYFFRIATGITNNQVTTNPSLPFVGAAMGNQIYLGRFMPPVAGGVLWSGDLLMFSTKEESGSISILNKTGTATTTLDATTAQWSAAAALAAGPVGTARKLYTRVPGGATLRTFTATGTDFTATGTGLKNYVATGLAITDTATKQLVIHHAAGGDITNLDASTGLPKTNRPSIMGDIINSAPAAIEYKWSEVSGSLSSYSTLSAFGGTRFRLVLVGTNQGWLHAFGEVTKTDAAGLVTGAVQELWSFLPTDFLANLNYLKDNGNAHRFMVDGTPVIYHLDLPPSGGGRGNGVVDSAERAVAIFGLRKGGRSYYALDIHDPFNPTLKWSLVPDEAASLTADRIATGGPTLDAAKALLAKAGFSTSTPAFGRIQDSSLVLRDAVFLGGGASNAEVDAQFSSTKLGRFVLALDAYSGQLLAAADLTAASAGGATVGPVASMVPFEFITNSGMAQRAYFTDSTGGLWAWGSKDTVATAPYTNFRKDTSKLDSWALRKVYQDDNVGNGARYTTLPAPFRVASYPVRAAAGSAIPAAVGIALVSGDRNNPLDRSYAAGTNPAPSNHRLTVVFDRQDSRAWGFDTAGGPDTGIGTTNLRNFTANEVTSTPGTLCTDSLFKLITPGCDDYYLAPKTGTPSFGYYVAFPSAASGTGFVAKGINPPLVVAGSLFYSYFTPVTSNACTGGSGTTSSWLITDVMNPIVTDTRSGLSITSGLKNTWSGVASDFLAMGTRSVLQGGMKEVSAADASKGIAAVTAVSLTTSATSVTERYPKARVWRTVH